MNQLPPEIEYKIFWSLSPLDLCRLSQVNKHWYNVTQNNEIWEYFCKRRFAHSNLTQGEYKKLSKIYPNFFQGWKDWYAFRSMFKREVAGKLSFDIVGYFDGQKRTSGKSIYGEFECHSQPSQHSNKLPCTFHFDEYHTYICAKLYESKVFRNRISIGRIEFPLFFLRDGECKIWIDIEDDEKDILKEEPQESSYTNDTTSKRKRLRSYSRYNSPENKKKSVNSKAFLESDDLGETIEIISKYPSKRQVLVHFFLTPVTYAIQDFEMIASVSRGTYNRQIESLFVREKDSNNSYFMKILPTDDDDESIFLKKDISYSHIPKWKSPEHPFLVNTVTNFHVSHKVFLVMEWISGGELFSELRRTNDGRFDENTAQFYASQLALCIRHLHENKIIYRDLKPENILLTSDGYCKITPRLPDQFVNKSKTGLPEHMSPELLLGYNATTKSDWWSFGTILYQMLVGQPPFTHHNVQTMVNRILEDDLYLPPHLSAESCTLLKGVLNRDIRKRYGFKRIRNSDFFSNFDWQKLIKKEIEAPLKPYRNKSINFPDSNKRSHGRVRESPPPSKRNLLL